MLINNCLSETWKGSLKVFLFEDYFVLLTCEIYECLGKQRRVQFVECPNDINGMIDAAKFADLALLLIDGSYGFEMVRYLVRDKHFNAEVVSEIYFSCWLE